jgi:hypothetical protein
LAKMNADVWREQAELRLDSLDSVCTYVVHLSKENVVVLDA